MQHILLISSLMFLLGSCNKNSVKAGDKVEIYLLSSYQLVPGKCKVDRSQAVLEAAPLISNEDILQYNDNTYQYLLSGTGFEKIKKLSGRTPFAVTVDKKVIFYGINMPPYMSSVCLHSITMSEGWDKPGSITMNLSYPGTQDGAGIDDQRNNAQLLASLKKQGKLR